MFYQSSSSKEFSPVLQIISVLSCFFCTSKLFNFTDPHLSGFLLRSVLKLWRVHLSVTYCFSLVAINLFFPLYFVFNAFSVTIQSREVSFQSCLFGVLHASCIWTVVLLDLGILLLWFYWVLFICLALNLSPASIPIIYRFGLLMLFHRSYMLILSFYFNLCQSWTV